MFTTAELVRRLKPIIGKKADELWQAYLASDKNGREDIRRILENLHDQYVDDVNADKIILSPPPILEQLYGDFPIGTVYYGDNAQFPFALMAQELNQHIGVFGRTGAGKSFFVKGLLRHIFAKRAALVFDWKGTYSDLVTDDVLFLLPGSKAFPFYFNPLNVEGIAQDQQTTYLRQVIEIFLECYLENLSLLTAEGVEFLLLLCMDDFMHKKQTATFRNVYEWLSRFRGHHRENEWRTTALNLVYKVVTGPLARIMQDGEKSLDWYLKQNIIFELNNIGNTKDKNFFIRSFILRIYYHFQQRGKSSCLNLFLVLEEAHNLLRRRHQSKETIVELLLRQIREFGVGICIVDQHPSLISVPALATYATISFNLRLRQDQEAMAAALNLDDHRCLGKLQTRFAIVKLSERFTSPFLIRTFDYHASPSHKRLFGNKNDALSVSPNEDVIRVLKNTEEDIRGFSEVLRHDAEVIRVIRNASKKVKKRLLWEEVLLMHVLENPVMGMVARYKKLNLNTYQGNKYKRSLLEHEFAKMESLPTTNGRLRVIVPISNGFAWLKQRGFVTDNDKEGGLDHLYWKRRLKARFCSEGCQVELEAKVLGNQAIDLVVSNYAKKVSVEIETGKNADEQIIKNINKGLASTDAVVIFFLKRTLVERFENKYDFSRVALVTSEMECLTATYSFLQGDII